MANGNIFGDLDLEKLNPYSTYLSDGNLSTVTEWIDTGCYALNAIISGSCYKGVPKGRVIGFSGPSQSGKSYIINKIIASFLKADDKAHAVIFDSESAVDAAALEKCGIDSERVLIFPIEIIEDCKHQAVTLLKKLQKKSHGKLIIAIDSLGNLMSAKEAKDAEEGKTATDMGNKAKALRSLMRTITMQCAVTETTLLFTNHTYGDPTAMFESLVKKQTGGEGPIYISSVLVQLAIEGKEKFDPKKAEKDGDEVDVVPLARKVTGGQVKGVTLRALTVKNRFSPPFLECKLVVNFKRGLNKYSGILEMAKAYNILQGTSSFVLPTGEKIGMYKKWKNDLDTWNKIITLVDEQVQKDIAYSDDNEQDQTEEQAEVTALDEV